MTQSERIMKYMQDFGAITPMEAFSDLGITKLATRVSEMKRKGIQLEDDWVNSRNRYGDSVRFKKYWLKEEA